jgi:aminopeptidase N
MRYLFILLFFIFSIQSYSQVENQLIYYNDSSNYDVKYYKIDISASTDSLYLEGNTQIVATVTQPLLNKFYIQLNDALVVDSVLINGLSIKYTHSGNWIKANLPITIIQGSVFTAKVFYKGYAATNSTIGGIAIDSYDDIKVLYTLSEPFSSLDFFACKQLLTDKVDSVSITLTVPKGLTGVANGKLVSVTDCPGNKVSFHWVSHYPTAYYLIAISISNYKEYSYKFYDKLCGDSILFQNYYYNSPGYLLEQKTNIDKTIEIINQFEKITGIGYPFYKEKYGHVTAPIGGGMENQTITMVNSFSFDLVAHELAHSWFGDMVTCADWQNIWINEGFASYLEYCANEIFYPDFSIKWLQKCISSATVNSEASIFVPDEDKWNERRIFSYYESYKKGAIVIHMLRHKINNDSVFFEVLNSFLKKFAYSNATANDFKTVAEQVLVMNLDTFFNQWYYGKGYPIVDITGIAKNRQLTLNIKQRSSSIDNNFTDLILEVKLKFKSKPDSLLHIDISNKEQSYSFRFGDIVTEVIINPNCNLLGVFSPIIEIDTTDIFTKASISPNPFTNHITIDFPNTGNTKSIKLFDTNGKTIGEWETSNTYCNVVLSNFQAGPYLLLAIDGDTTYKFKVVKAY